MKKIFFYVAIIFLMFSYSASISEAVPYTIGMKNISQRITTGQANVLFIGDSLTSDAFPRVQRYGAMREWNTTWRGVYFQYGAAGGQGFNLYNEAGPPIANKTSVLAGQAYPTYGGTGLNIHDASGYLFNQNPAFGTLFARNVLAETEYGDWVSDFSNNHNLSTRLIYVSSPNATGISAYIRDRASVFTETINIGLLNDTPQGIYWKELNISNSTGSACCVEAGFDDGGEVQNTTGKNAWNPLGTMIYRNDISNGLIIGTVSSGGWNAQDHAGVNETKFYNNASITQFLNATKMNIFVIWLGTNSAPDEWNGANTGQFQNHIRKIIDRYTIAYYQAHIGEANIPKPQFMLVPTWDTSNGDAARLAEERDLVNITLTQSSNANYASNVTIGLVNLRLFINDTNGSWLNWQGAYLGDGIHENTNGSVIFARYMWQQIVRGINSNNGTISPIFNWTTETWTITNTSIDSSTALFNNTDLYTQVLNISLSSMNSYLVYNNTNNIVATSCTALSECSTPLGLYTSINLQGNYSYVYALNTLNISEFTPRNFSPFWYSLSNSSTKKIASNLTSPLNMTVYLNVSTCSLASVRYKSHTGTYNVTFTPNSFGWSCAGNSLQIVGAYIEPATGSNEFILNAQEGYVCTPSEKNVYGLIVFFSVLWILVPGGLIYVKFKNNFKEFLSMVNSKMILGSFIYLSIGIAMIIAVANSVTSFCP